MMVFKRWAMASSVHCAKDSLIVFWISSSVATSIEAVACRTQYETKIRNKKQTQKKRSLSPKQVHRQAHSSLGKRRKKKKKGRQKQFLVERTSSRIRILEWRRSARAKHNNCRCPAEKLLPPDATSRSRPRPSERMYGPRLACHTKPHRNVKQKEEAAQLMASKR